MFHKNKQKYIRNVFKEPQLGDYRRQRSYIAISKKNILSFLLILIIGGILYTVFYSPFFEIKNIDVEGTDNKEKEEIINLAKDELDKGNFLFKSKNYLFFSKKSLRESIEKNFNFEFINIEKKLNSIKVVVSQKKTSLVWLSNGKYYNVDSNGFVLKEVKIISVKLLEAQNLNTNTNVNSNTNTNNTTPIQEIKDDSQLDKSLPEVVDESNKEISEGMNIVSKNMVNYILEINKNITNVTEIKLKNFRLINPQITEIHAVAEEGFQIYFESTNDLQKQLDKLAIVYKQKIKKDKMKVQYIDLRANDDTVYVK